MALAPLHPFQRPVRRRGQLDQDAVAPATLPPASTTPMTPALRIRLPSGLRPSTAAVRPR